MSEFASNDLFFRPRIIQDIEVNGSMIYRVGQLLLQKGQQIKEVLQRGLDTDFASHFERIGEGIRRLLSGRWNNFVEKILPDRTADTNTTAPVTDEHQPLPSFFDRLRGLLVNKFVLSLTNDELKIIHKLESIINQIKVFKNAFIQASISRKFQGFFSMN